MPRSKLFIIVFACGLANAMIKPVNIHIEEFGLYQSLLDGFGISFIVWFAIYCSFDLLRKNSCGITSHNDQNMAILTMCLFAIPSAFISWIALSFFAAYCSFFALQAKTFSRNAALIMLAISLRIPVSDTLLKLAADMLLQLDASLTTAFLSLIEPAANRQGNIILGPDGHELFIMTGCTSFTNVSLALLLWFTVLRTKITHWNHRLTLTMIPLITAVMGINIIRLSMMALSHEHYVFYHEEWGSDFINISILLTALGFALLCIFFETHEKKGKPYHA